jgi:hypothetical protein
VALRSRRTRSCVVPGSRGIGLPPIRSFVAGIVRHFVTARPMRALTQSLGQSPDSQARNKQPTKFSEVRAVASRNSLYQIFVLNVALGTGQRAKSCSPLPIGTRVRDKAGKIATANFREFFF